MRTGIFNLRRGAPAGRAVRGGFTLIEVAVATAILGLGIVALMSAVAAGTRTSDAAKKLTQAVFLAQEIRELTLKLPFVDPDAGDKASPPGPDSADPQVFTDDLDDLLGVTYSPPRDAQNLNNQVTRIADMTGWSQIIDLSWRDPANLTQKVANGASDVVYVQVDIAFRGRTVLAAGWIVTKRSTE